MRRTGSMSSRASTSRAGGAERYGAQDGAGDSLDRRDEYLRMTAAWAEEEGFLRELCRTCALDLDAASRTVVHPSFGAIGLPKHISGQGHVLMAGLLEKRGSKAPWTWKRRLLVVTADLQLRYYNPDEVTLNAPTLLSSKTGLLGTVELAGCAVASPGKHGRTTFDIVSSEGTFSMRLSDEDARQVWVDNLRVAISAELVAVVSSNNNKQHYNGFTEGPVDVPVLLSVQPDCTVAALRAQIVQKLVPAGMLPAFLPLEDVDKITLRFYREISRNLANSQFLDAVPAALAALEEPSELSRHPTVASIDGDDVSTLSAHRRFVRCTVEVITRRSRHPFVAKIAERLVVEARLGEVQAHLLVNHPHFSDPEWLSARAAELEMDVAGLSAFLGPWLSAVVHMHFHDPSGEGHRMYLNSIEEPVADFCSTTLLPVIRGQPEALWALRVGERKKAIAELIAPQVAALADADGAAGATAALNAIGSLFHGWLTDYDALKHDEEDEGEAPELLPPPSAESFPSADAELPVMLKFLPWAMKVLRDDPGDHLRTLELLHALLSAAVGMDEVSFASYEPGLLAAVAELQNDQHGGTTEAKDAAGM
eukprot:CAMPEP_0198420930 /NCGR_PEP_ID=MMETSP1452-20131203/1268_1 /TAXON_ID=1181717 /ORGANISM="Synchroma pusillum, Strain CCMP3072" /LENGTH=593 /DNA_ID=CAMNT_0044141111 /DNA_START=12 /DNA_END=1793 /DNA_ORIENTATION=-